MSLLGEGASRGANPFLAQMEAVYQRQAGQRIGLVRGRHLVDWVPTVGELLDEGREEEALELLLEIIEAAEQVSKADDVPPPKRYTQQAADIYEMWGDDEGELAVLERYERACPPGTGDPELLERLDDLRDDYLDDEYLDDDDDPDEE